MIIDEKQVGWYCSNQSAQTYVLCFHNKDERYKGDTVSVELGNLGLHNACSYYVNKDPKNYPMAWFKNKDGAMRCSPDKPENCAKDETIYMQYDSPLERLIDYAHDLQEEHKGLSDQQLNEHLYGNFNGRKRNARWYDERLRRGIQN